MGRPVHHLPRNLPLTRSNESLLRKELKQTFVVPLDSEVIRVHQPRTDVWDGSADRAGDLADGAGGDEGAVHDLVPITTVASAASDLTTRATRP